MKATKLAGALSPAVASAGRREGQADVDRGDCRRRTHASAACEPGLAVVFQPQGCTCSNSAAARATWRCQPQKLVLCTFYIHIYQTFDEIIRLVSVHCAATPLAK